MSTTENTTLDLVACPQCAAPAEVIDRFVLESTDGPLEHAKVRCVQRHWFTVLVESLSGRSAEEPRRWAPAPRSS